MARESANGKHRAAHDGLPPMFIGPTRRALCVLVAAGLAQALLGGLSAFALRRAFHSASSAGIVTTITILVIAAVALGVLRLTERVLAEWMSQRYVHQVRTALIRASIRESSGRSVGVTVARTTNDLTSLRNWMAFGVAPLASGIPLVIGAGIALAVLSPLLVVAAAIPLLALAGSLRGLTTVAYERSRRLRKLRGRLSAHISDTVLAAPAIRAGGGESRELKRIQERSHAVVDAAVRRARVAGALRATTATSTGLGTAAVVATGLYARLPMGTVAAGVTVLGFLVAPVQDLGRVVEYRQMYRAARNILEPALAGSRTLDQSSRVDDTAGPSDAMTALHVRDLRLRDGTPMPDLDVPAGAKIVISGDDRRTITELIEYLAGLRAPNPGAQVWVAGEAPHALDPRDRRRLVGYASQGMRLERGTVSRALRYRRPDSVLTSAELRSFDLEGTLAGLPHGDATELRHGGEPLTVPERARVLLARAMLGDPPLLLLDHLDADLGVPYLPVLRRLLRRYDGVLLLASDRPFELVSATHTWSPGCNRPISAPAEAG